MKQSTSVGECRQRFFIILKMLEGKPRPTEPTLHTSVDPDSLLKILTSTCTVHIHAADDLLLRNYICSWFIARGN